MRGIRFACVASVAAALLALGAVGASAFTYAPPEFGHCVKNAKGERGAGYLTSRCMEHVSSGAKYHWVAGPGAKSGFTASGSADLYAWNGSNRRATPIVECSSSSTTGTFTGPRSETASLTLSGCRAGSSPCHSPAAEEGTVRFEPLEGLLVLELRGDIRWRKPLVQWTPAFGETLASLQCGATSVLVTGGVFQVVTGEKLLSSEPDGLNVYKEGVQDPGCRERISETPPYEYGPEPVCVYPSISVNGAPAVLGGISISGTQTDEEAIEADVYLG